MEGFFVEVKEKGRIVFALDLPTLDCIRVPQLLGSDRLTPEPINWRPDGPGRFAAEHSAVVGQVGDFTIHRFELTARVHS